MPSSGSPDPPDPDGAQRRVGLSIRRQTACTAEVSPGSAGQHSVERVVERPISAVDVEHTMRGALVVQQASQHGGDVIARDRASAGRRVHAYAP